MVQAMRIYVTVDHNSACPTDFLPIGICHYKTLNTVSCTLPLPSVLLQQQLHRYLLYRYLLQNANLCKFQIEFEWFCDADMAAGASHNTMLSSV